jgi:regulator of replication initiation timing
MPDKGRAMTQTYYEKQSKLLKLYQESFARKEMNVKETVMALRMIGFSEEIAAKRVNEWAAQANIVVLDTERAKKARLKQRISLENYVLRMRLGKKYYEEFTKLRSKYKNKELSKEDAVQKLIQTGYSREFSECIVDKWEVERE